MSFSYNLTINIFYQIQLSLQDQRLGRVTEPKGGLLLWVTSFIAMTQVNRLPAGQTVSR